VTGIAGVFEEIVGMLTIGLDRTHPPGDHRDCPRAGTANR
jgi:hypothetical protein